MVFETVSFPSSSPNLFSFLFLSFIYSSIHSFTYSFFLLSSSSSCSAAAAASSSSFSAFSSSSASPYQGRLDLHCRSTLLDCRVILLLLLSILVLVLLFFLHVLFFCLCKQKQFSSPFFVFSSCSFFLFSSSACVNEKQYSGFGADVTDCPPVKMNTGRWTLIQTGSDKSLRTETPSIHTDGSTLNCRYCLCGPGCRALIVGVQSGDGVILFLPQPSVARLLLCLPHCV